VSTRRNHTKREVELEARIDDLGGKLERARDASKELAVEAATDALTGLANHSAFRQRLGVEVERAHRYSRPLALACLDIDGFKDVNDQFGHQVGDRVLRDVAERLVMIARTTDLPARVGGDEFVILLPETTAEAAEVVSRRAHELIRVDLAGPAPSITVSIGICDLEHASTAEDLLRFADGALYWAKEHGRDAVWRYAPEVVIDISQEERAARLAHSQALVGITALARAVDAKSQSTLLHSERVASLARRLAVALDWPEARAEKLHEVALVHDVGKVAVPDHVLLKPRSLTASEYDVVKTHAELGAQITSEVLNDEQISWLRSHHERCDGTGYPDGLADRAIPDGARLLAVADSWDVMTSERPYSPALDPTEAIEECQRCVGTQFFPEPVAVLTSPQFEQTLRIFANEQAARHGNEQRLANAAGPVYALRCECGAPQCPARVHVPAGEYRAIRAHDRRYFVYPGHEIVDAERVLLTTEFYNVVEKV
jgi:diguanylate cyclase (GGDEF)-like protein